MERDFMGLNSKESVIKEEAFDGLKDSAPAKAPGEHWPFANKVSTLPHFMRHMSAHQDSAIKTTAGPVASSGFAQNLAGFLAKPPHAPSAASIAGLVDPWMPSLRQKTLLRTSLICWSRRSPVLVRSSGV